MWEGTALGKKWRFHILTLFGFWSVDCEGIHLWVMMILFKGTRKTPHPQESFLPIFQGGIHDLVLGSLLGNLKPYSNNQLNFEHQFPCFGTTTKHDVREDLRPWYALLEEGWRQRDQTLRGLLTPKVTMSCEVISHIHIILRIQNFYIPTWSYHVVYNFFFLSNFLTLILVYCLISVY